MQRRERDPERGEPDQLAHSFLSPVLPALDLPAEPVPPDVDDDDDDDDEEVL